MLLVLAAVMAYANSFSGPFVFDDGPATLDNPSIQSLLPPWRSLAPPPGTTVSGRPVANLTLALNYAISGTRVWSYHVGNLAILILGGLALFGIVRRTLRGPRLTPRFGRDADWLAGVVVLLWMLHPVQTESTTYLVQRVESLMGLFYLLTFYCFIRSLDSHRPAWWQAGAVAASFLGMGTKEVMATAPLLLLLYDRIFVAPSWGTIWLRRRRLYLGLALSWLLLAALAAETGFTRNGSAGFSSGYSASTYWGVQTWAIARYLHLALWPDALTIDYGPALGAAPATIAVDGLFVVALVLVTGWACLRRSPLGFLGAWFLVILAPTSLVPVGTQSVAEHRLYLSLAAVTCLVGVGLYRLIGRRALLLLGFLGTFEGVLTFRRNEVYRSPEALWTDTAAKAPGNPRAFCSLGQALALLPGRLPDAVAQFRTALRLHPNYSEAHADLAEALARLPDRQGEAIAEMDQAVQARPGMAAWQAELGTWQCAAGQPDAGLAHLQVALQLDAANPQLHLTVGNALAQSGQIPAAIDQYDEALRLEPTFAEASSNLGLLLSRSGRPAEGLARIKTALALRPDLVPAHYALGVVLLQAGQREGAAAQFDEVLRLSPRHEGARRMLHLLGSAP